MGVNKKLIEFAKRSVKLAYVRWMQRHDQLKRAHLPSTRFKGLGPELWGCQVTKDGHMSIHEVDAVKLAEKYGTPLHIVHKKQLLRNYKEFIGAFRKVLPRVVLATSYKTNPLPGVLSVLHGAGTWAEVISHFELWLALKLGVPPERIIINGPGKGRECIAFGVEQGVALINIDGRDEILWLVEAARKKGCRVDVGLRLVTTVGWKGQFGTRIESGESLETFRELKRHPELNPCALHLHIGTGIKDVSAYLKAIGEVVRFAEQLREELDIHIRIYDFGGGFGVPTVRTPDVWDLRMSDFGYPARMPFPEDCPTPAEYADSIAMIIKQNLKGFDDAPPLIIFEPGRAITSSAQLLLLKVLTVKQAKEGVPRVILDGGKNIAIPLGYEIHQIFPANKMCEEIGGQYDLYGPLCHTGDIVARCKELPILQPDDLIAIMDTGAYFIPNQMNFSHPRPPVVMVEDGSVEIIRSRETFDDLVKLDSIIEK